MLNLTPYPTIKYAKDVKINIPSNAPSVPLGDYFFNFDAEINNAKLTGICFVPLTMNSAANSCSVEQAKVVYITLVDKNNQRIVDKLPINALYTLNASGNIILRRFANKISLENSFVTINGDDLSNVNIHFTFYYNPNI